jgi:2-iminobutanoate/2-iminopropanoate deaminase
VPISQEVTMSRHTINTQRAPAAIGPYVQAVAAGGFLFVSMQIALHPETGSMVGSTAGGQVRQCLHNLQAVLEAAGGSLADVVKTTVYLVDINQFTAVNEVYAEFFTGELPARGVLQAAALPKEALVAVEAVACLSG